MHTIGRYYGAQRTLDGALTIAFEVDDDDEMLAKLEEHKDRELVIDTKLYRKGRSLNANAYFWKLCDEIAKVLGSDKDTIYLMELEKYGVFSDMEVIAEAADIVAAHFRHVSELYRYDTVRADTGETRAMVALRCYTGSHEYDTKEMSDLINGTVNDAKDLGIDTWTREEIEYLVRQWKGRL